MQSSNDHRYGWLVFWEEREIAVLDYVQYGDFRCQFKVSLRGDSGEAERLLVRLADKSRRPEAGFSYINRHTGSRAEDLDFLFNYKLGEGRALIRDQRLTLFPETSPAVTQTSRKRPWYASLMERWTRR